MNKSTLVIRQHVLIDQVIHDGNSGSAMKCDDCSATYNISAIVTSTTANTHENTYNTDTTIVFTYI